MNWKKFKKRLLAVPFWAIPFIAFGFYDMTNQGPNVTNLMLICIPLALAALFFAYKLKTDEPKKNLKRERI